MEKILENLQWLWANIVQTIQYIGTLPNKQIFILFLYVLGFICFMFVLWTSKDTKDKTIFFKNRPKAKKNLSISLIGNKYYDMFMEYLLTANGDFEDSTEKLYSEMVKAALIAIGVGAAGYLMDLATYGYILGAVLLFYPIIFRLLNKKDFKKKYIADFYTFLNYLTLYLSGGIPMKRALIEVNNLFPEKAAIKPKLKNIISNNALSGMSGDTYISALEELNEGLDYLEIQNFLNAAKRSLERGDAIADTLLSQISDLQKRSELGKKAYIDSKGTTFEMLKVMFCMVPGIIIFAVPIFIYAITAITGL